MSGNRDSGEREDASGDPGTWPVGLSWLLSALIIGAALGVGGLTLINRNRPAPISIETPTPAPPPGPTASPKPILVHVSGQVMTPDVYQLPYDSIVKEAIDAAGGFAPNADTSAVNLAQRLADGYQVYVPSLDEQDAGPVTILRGPDASTQENVTGGSLDSTGLVNINTASIDQLDTLPGIGPTLGRRIIQYREDNGWFQSKEEIMNVSGIGTSTFSKIEGLITTE
jgi:competence protein ComEA